MNNQYTPKWINDDKFTFFNNLTSIEVHKFKKIVIFDLDGTIVKTKSGKIHPINSDDWVFNYSNVVDVFSKLDNTIIGVITNQKGIKSTNNLIDWQKKLNNIMKHIKFNFVFASLKDDRYRKPMIGSWQYIKDNYLKNFNLQSNEQIIYVGDACGRQNDFSDTDLKFAYNSGFKFSTPEKFFNVKVAKQIATISYPELNYYSKIEFNKILNTITKSFDKEKILIMMIGFPSCGKSFMRKYFINYNQNFKYFNKDDITAKNINNNLIHKHNSNINFVIDDNTNTTLKNRTITFKQYNDHFKIGIFFDYEIDQAMHLNYMRMYWYGAELIKKVAYYTLNKKMDKPTDKEFDLLIKFDKILPDFNFESNLKYYF
jgi:bifunctional polynucleotide phosphatase/kinase